MKPALELVTFEAPEPRLSQPPFWGRCGRAVAMLLIASTAHQWLLPPAASPRPGPAMPFPRSPLAPPSHKLIAGAPGAVEVVSELVNAVSDSTAVGTSGLVPPPPAPVIRAAASTSFGDTPASPAAMEAPALPPAPQPDPQPAVLAVPVELPAESDVPPPTPPVVEPVVAKRPVPAPVPVDQQQLVRLLLEQYADAYGRLDVNAAKALWPTLDDRALRRAFAQLEAQQVKFDSCGITIDGRDARARCAGQASYRPRVGSRELRSAAREWTFDLAQAQNGWRIVDARVR